MCAGGYGVFYSYVRVVLKKYIHSFVIQYGN